MRRGSSSLLLFTSCGNSSVGRAQPCQGWGREFESRFPLSDESSLSDWIRLLFCADFRRFLFLVLLFPHSACRSAKECVFLSKSIPESPMKLRFRIPYFTAPGEQLRLEWENLPAPSLALCEKPPGERTGGSPNRDGVARRERCNRGLENEVS